jgi:hypothetical protein
LISFARTLQKRIELKRLPGAPAPPWQAMSDRGDRFRAYLERQGGAVDASSGTQSQRAITRSQQHHETESLTVVAHKQYKGQRRIQSPEKACDAMADWLYRTVTMNFDFTREVCEQARYQIQHDLLDQYRGTTTATTFKGLVEELSPATFSDDAPALISEYAGLLLSCLLALRQDPRWMYNSIGTACDRARQLKEAPRIAR